LSEKRWLSRYPDGVRPQLEYPVRPLHSLLDDAAERFGSNTATSFFRGKLTWAGGQRAGRHGRTRGGRAGRHSGKADGARGSGGDSAWS